MAQHMDMEFIETPIFTKAITELLSDNEYSDFQKYLVENPESGDVIKGGFGIRKVRWNLANLSEQEKKIFGEIARGFAK